ncbi:MAG: hypothetical protein ABWX94_01850 [Candidatus Saccharimonadales bacterium]
MSVTSTNKRVNFYASDEGVEIKQTLQHMESDVSYNTVSSYSANAVRYLDNIIPFVDKHMEYLNVHPATDARQYISNLRLKTRIR